MRYLILGVLLVVGQGLAGASECPPGTTTQVIGQVFTANDTTGPTTGYGVISTVGHLVRRITVSCGSACTAGLYDSDSTVSLPMGNDKVRAEPGAPANESRSLEFDPPMSFKNGISARDDANVNAVLVEECR